MKDYITPEMVDKCIEIVKDAEYDCDKYTFRVYDHAPCSITQYDFPLIIDKALLLLKRQARLTPLDAFIEFPFGDEKPKIKDDKGHLIPITIFQDRKE